MAMIQKCDQLSDRTDRSDLSNGYTQVQCT